MTRPRWCLQILAVGVISVSAVLVTRAEPGAAPGPNDGDLFGFYRITATDDLGDGESQVTMAVELWNQGSVDLFNVTLSLEDPMTPGSFCGSIQIGTLASGATVEATGVAFAPSAVCTDWERGFVPMFQIDFEDSAGNWGHGTIALSSSPFVMGGE